MLAVIIIIVLKSDGKILWLVYFNIIQVRNTWTDHLFRDLFCSSLKIETEHLLSFTAHQTLCWKFTYPLLDSSQDHEIARN